VTMNGMAVARTNCMMLIPNIPRTIPINVAMKFAS
jgi:hypothetical protein